MISYLSVRLGKMSVGPNLPQEFDYVSNMRKSIVAIIWTPTFEWYVVGCGSKNKHQKDMCVEEIGVL